jgi:hypothetical protein
MVFEFSRYRMMSAGNPFRIPIKDMKGSTLGRYDSQMENTTKVGCATALKKGLGVVHGS